MRVLIYSETEAAKAKKDALRAEGHHASLRNPHYFDAESFSVCDLAIADDPKIIDAHGKVGIKAEVLTLAADLAAEVFPTEAPKPEPIRRRPEPKK